MRFKDRISAEKIIHRAIDAGFNYIDTSPCYCYKSEDENSESWVGSAVNDPDYRSRVMVSAKCAPGNGGWGLGDFDKAKGFGVRSAGQLGEMFEQSKKRIGLSRFDYYHLWTTHTMEQFNEALKPGGWYDGVMARKHQWDHLGVTTHAGDDIILQFLESKKFESVTMPFNVVNTTRMKTVEYCRKNGITVIAMNPLAGGFLAANEKLKELALRYLMALEGVRILIGFSAVEEVDYAKWILDTTKDYKRSPEQILEEVSTLINATEARCTACGYCLPCPEGIAIGACLSYYNLYKYMGMEEAKKAFKNKQWEDGLRLDRCKKCGICESRCPNNLPVMEIIRDAQAMLYDKAEQKSN